MSGTHQTPPYAPILARTVFDARATTTKFVQQVLVLLASWHAYARQRVGFELVTIGAASRHLLDYATELGAQHRQCSPDPNDVFSKTSNTVRGAEDPESSHRVLLLDNDTWFARDPAFLEGVPDDVVGGSVAGGERVTIQQWTDIEKHIGLRPLDDCIVPLKERRNALLSGREPRTINYVYFNGGVLLLPLRSGFAAVWREHVRRIAQHFVDSPLRSKDVYGSNMAGLATACRVFGRVRYLPDSFNFRPISFALGLADVASDIDIVHMAGNVACDEDATLSERMRMFWAVRVEQLVHTMSDVLGGAELVRRASIADEARGQLDSLIRTYDLDAVYRRCRR